MMNYLKNLIALFTFFIVPQLLNGQNYSQIWDKTYGGSSRDWNSSVVKNDNGSFFIIGDSETNIDGDKTVALCNNLPDHSDVWLIKCDINGNILWQKNYGGEGDERTPQLILLNNPNKEMIFACYSTSDIACDKTEPNRDTIPLISADYWIAKLDSNGVVLWEKTLGGDNYDDYTRIAVLSTGEIIVCGESNSPVGYDKTIPNYSISNDLWAVKLDANGNIISDHVFGGTSGEFLASVIPDDQGGYLLAGSTNSDISGDISQPGQGNLDFWMIKVDNMGNKVWDKRFGGAGPDQCNHAIRTTDNGYLLCGFTVSPQGGDVSQAPKGLQDYWVVKTDNSGNKIWDKRFGGSSGSFGTHAINWNGGTYWISGYSSSGNVIDVTQPSFGGSDYWILQIDNLGNKLFDKRFGGSGNEFYGSLLHMSDSTFLAFGYSDTGSSSVKTATSKGWFDYWMVKFSYNDGTVGIDDGPVAVEASLVSIYPNPTKDFIIARNHSKSDLMIRYRIRDLAGRIVLEKNIPEGLRPGAEERIELPGFNSGLYIFKSEFESGGTFVNRLIRL
jgi:hypothetical protein